MLSYKTILIWIISLLALKTKKTHLVGVVTAEVIMIKTPRFLHNNPNILFMMTAEIARLVNLRYRVVMKDRPFYKCDLNRKRRKWKLLPFP